MPFDSSATLFYVSLAMSAAAVVLFVWLIREPRDREKRNPDRP